MSYRSPILDRPGAVAATGPDEGVAWHYGEPVAEQRALAGGGAVVDQSHLGVVRLTGPDRLSWLHSITSQDVEHLAPRTSTELFVLSPQGRIEHALAVVDDGTSTWLITERDHVEALVAWLTRMRFMRQVEIDDVTDSYAAIGEPVAAEGVEGEPVTWWDAWPRVAVGGTRYGPAEQEHPGADRAWRLVLVPRDTLSEAVAEREAAGWRLAGTWATEAMRVEAWRPRLAREVDDRSVPHELDWLRTAVHLHKGCYRGQETVARVHNLGRPPRRVVMLHLDGSQHVVPDGGAEVRRDGADGKVVGTVTTVARHHELGPVALAVVKRNLPDDAPLVVVGTVGTGADAQELVVDATQETIVPAEGVSADRPEGRRETLRGLTPRGGDGAQSLL